MLELLSAELADADPDPRLMEFGRFVGSWDLDAAFFDDDGAPEPTSAEWHFAWILGGRALQDVLVFPALGSGELLATHRIGTSIRFFDGEADFWRVVWINPATGTMYKLSGGVDGDRIVLDGDPHDGEPTQWIFDDITDSSFVWRGFVSDDERGTWRLVQEMRAERRSQPH